MLFEIADMKHASPATVSRGGVLFINETDVGWKPFLESWRETLPDQIAQSQFYLLFSYYFEQVRANKEQKQTVDEETEKRQQEKRNEHAHSLQKRERKLHDEKREEDKER